MVVPGTGNIVRLSFENVDISMGGSDKIQRIVTVRSIK